MVARILNVSGLHLGSGRDLLAPQDDNAAGFWEHQGFLTLNKEILAAFEGGWDIPPNLEAGWETDPRLDDIAERARAVVAELARHAPWGWKDPRNSLTLPFWRRLVPDLRVVVCVRSPLEIAASLNRRGASTDAFAFRLWLAYEDALAAATADVDRIVTHFDSYFRDAPSEAERLVAWAGLSPDEGAIDEACATVATDLRHHRTTQELVAVASRPLVSTYLARCAEAGPVFAASQLEDARSGELIAQERQLAELRRELDRARSDLTRARSDLDTTQDELVATRSELERTRRQVETVRGELSDARASAAREARTRAAAEAQATELLGSRSFRYTAPLRAGKARAARFRNRLAGLAVGAMRPARSRLRRAKRLATSSRDGAADSPRYRATPEDAEALRARIVSETPPAVRTSGPRVSAVIPNLNGEHHLRRCLGGLAETAYGDLEVVVVDNGSTDGSLANLETLEAPFDLRIVRNGENQTFSEANNQGAASATGELLLFLNNDVEPIEPGWLGRMVETLLAEDAAAVGARLVYPRRPGLDNAGDIEAPDLSLQHRGIDFAGPGVPRGRNLGRGEDPCAPVVRQSCDVPAVTAACMLVTRTAFAGAGGFCEDYVYGTEDVDLCLGLRERGGRIVYVADAVLWHHEFATQNVRGRTEKRLNRARNQTVFASRWGPRLFRAVLADRLRGERAWSEDALHVAITITRDDRSAGYGDWYTAHELGDALDELGWRVSYVERYRDRWYDIDPGIDVLVVLLDAFDVHRAPPHVVTVAWIRNWTDRWIDQPGFEDYDVVLTSSRRSKEIVEERSSKVGHLFPLATNPDRFHPTEPDSVLAADVVTTANYWKAPRGLVDALPSLGDAFAVKAFGNGWESVGAFRDLHAGNLPYDRVCAAYASARIVLDDTAGHAKPYAAVNARVFDALAAGAFVLTDNDEGVRELFDEAFPTWNDASSLRAQVEAYLADPEGRGAAVERYRGIVLDRHTYARRASELRDLLLAWCEAPRVGIDVGVPERRQVDQWGDFHYARALGRQLERRGHPTRVHLLPEWGQPHTAHVDVILHLFGLSRLEPRVGQVNVLWVISHPDLVTAEMCERYDLVLVASDRFAEDLAERAAVPVVPLHQAVDPERFRPDPSGPAHELLFVANSRRVRRKIVDDLAGTHYDLAVYGHDWTSDLIDTRHVRGDHIPNSELARYYSSAAIVLNDHWPDMREFGLISNRIYDALACGAFVVSDHVDGIEGEFDGSVATYETPEELPELLDRYLREPEERRRMAERGRRAVLERHTFAHRVDTILELIDPLLQEGGTGIPHSRLAARA